jgi:hypothetical protein
MRICRYEEICKYADSIVADKNVDAGMDMHALWRYLSLSRYERAAPPP